MVRTFARKEHLRKTGLQLILASIASLVLYVVATIEFSSHMGMIAWLLLVLPLVCFVCHFVGFGYYAISKGYSVVIGVLLAVLGLPGILVLLVLPDQSSINPGRAGSG